MNDKYLGKEGITEKYDSKGTYINWIQNAGMGLGYGYSLVHMMFDLFEGKDLYFKDLKDAVGGFLIGTGSFAIGRYLHKRNEKKKEKALRNLEKNLVEERK